MRRSLCKRLLTVGLAAGAAVSLLSASPAHADPNNVLGIAGSDTTIDVMTDILATNAPADVYNIRPGPLQATDITVPGDPFCASVTYIHNPPAGGPKVQAPNGSTAGRDVLRDSASTSVNYPVAPNGTNYDTGNGCIDVARSSTAPRAISATEPAELEYYAFGLDSVGWATTSLNAPATMTLQQLRDIYNCLITDWSQLPGGGTGQIQRAIAQTGSGTYDFFVRSVLGNVTPPASGVDCPPLVFVQENAGNQLLLDTPVDNAAKYDQYIVNYSAGKWVYQATNRANPTLDIRAGVRMGGITREAAASCDPSATGYNVRWTGSGFLLNNADVICGTNVASVSTTAFNSTITAAPGSFTPAMVGKAVEGVNIFGGTVITAVAGGGASATISPGASATGTASIAVGVAIVSESNPNTLNQTDVSIYPGVRLIWNIVHQLSPSYDEALALVGFDDTLGGIKSPICDAANIGEIADNGFLDLPPLTSPGGNVGTTCRKG